MTPARAPLGDRLRERRVHYLLAAAVAFAAAPVLTLLLPRPLPNALAATVEAQGVLLDRVRAAWSGG